MKDTNLRAMMSEANSIRPRLHDYIMAHFPVAREQELSDDDSLLQSGAAVPNP